MNTLILIVTTCFLVEGNSSPTFINDIDDNKSQNLFKSDFVEQGSDASYAIQAVVALEEQKLLERTLDVLSEEKTIFSRTFKDNDITQKHHNKRTLDGLGQGNLLRRSLDGLGQGNLLRRSLDGLGQGNLLKRSTDDLGQRNLLRRSFDELGQENVLRRSLDGLGQGNLLRRSLDGLGQGNLLRRSLDGLDQGNLLRSLDGLGQGNILKRSLEAKKGKYLWISWII